MSKEIYISTTPHETRLAIVEDEQLAEIYFERENEYTLAGSIYNGRVTRVLPGMQSSFVDIGLERDAFLYVTDFMEEQGDAADFDSADGGSRRQPSSQRDASDSRAESAGRERPERSRGRRSIGERTVADRPAATEAVAETETTTSFDEPIAPAPTEGASGLDEESGTLGSRRWRGRRGRRRGRGPREDSTTTTEPAELPQAQPDSAMDDNGVMDGLYADDAIEIDLSASAEPSTDENRSGQLRDNRTARSRGRGRGRVARTEEQPAFDNSYAGYGSPAAEPDDVAGGPTVLPGESIRKYRDPADVAAEEAEKARTAPAAQTVQLVSRPGIEITGWDGGAVLPGETLGRHRRAGRDTQNSARAAASSVAVGGEESPAAEEKQAVNPIAGAADFAPSIAPEEPSGLTNLPDHSADSPMAAAPPVESDEPADEQQSDTLEGLSASAPLVGETLPAESGKPETAEAEFEPQEGARASLGTDSRRDLRRLEQPFSPAEPQPSDEPAEVVGQTPDATTYDLGAAETASARESRPDAVPEADPVPSLEPAQPEFTTLQSSGEMVSDVAEIGLELPYGHELSAQDNNSPAEPVELEGAVHDRDVPTEAAPVVPVSEEEAEDDERGLGVHAYGDGDFHEEELDEELDGEDFEYRAAYTVMDESEEEYEEETLDEDSETVAPTYQAAPAPPQDAEEDAEETITYAGGFTEADFGGEPDEDEETTEATPRQPLSQREGNRRPALGRGDRRGGRANNDRGRGGRRQSVQTMDLPAINDLLKPGQEVLVQIAKEPIAKKGARITSHIALPGRFLVFMPTVNHTGVSRKISSDEERRRLKSLLLAEKGEAQGGFIVRTAAAGASDEELRNDLRFLIQMWTDIKARSESSKSPALIYHDLNLVERILRDQVTDNFSAIWVDTEAEYERVLRFLQRFQPSLVRRVKLYTKETPLFEHFGVTAEIDKALKSKVWLKSGGSIVINQTEALVAIDINTGKYVGKTARLEDTILKTNLDAIPEIVRQIRLRDLGGIIVIDFIDMDERKNRAKVLQTLEDAMKVDRAPSKILPFNDFGLVIMTRKRVKQSLERTLCMPDPITEGTGMIKSPITIANEIYVEMRKMHRHLEKTDVMLRVHPEVVKTLKSNGGKRLQELEDMTRKTILVKSDPALSPEAFDIH